MASPTTRRPSERPRVDTFIKAQKDFQQLAEQESSLQSRLYFDSLPEASALREAIQTLRQGPAWYRPFQSAWRKAVATHRLIAKEKTKASPASRLAELEELVTWTAHKKSWLENESYRRVIGTTDSEEIQFEGLSEIGKWVSNSTKALKQVHVGVETFDPVAVSEHRLIYLRDAATELTTLVGQLLSFERRAAETLPADTVRLIGLNRMDSFEQRLESLRKTSTAIDASYRVCETLLRSDTRLSPSIKSGRALLEAARLRECLSKNAEFVRLLGRQYQGENTNLQRLRAAVTYGRLVRAAALPGPVEKLLLDEASASNYARMSAGISALQNGWDKVSEFEKTMAEFGRFILTDWVPDSPDLLTYVQALAAKARYAIEHVESLLPWAQYFQLRGDAEKNRLGSFIALLEGGTIAGGDVANLFGYRFYATIARNIFKSKPTLARFSGTRHSTVREEFAVLDKEIISVRGRQVASFSKTTARPPAGMAGARVDQKTELELLYHLIPQSRPRMPVRKMLRQAGRAIQELKPCFMMGPQAVAQFLQPGAIHFDIVIMDEASQLKPEEAIGSIARGSQLIVVGDPKQLPPTNFFSRMSQPSDEDSDNETAVGDAQSILDVCISHFQPVRSLRWHYRSRHESLIAFSNKAFYQGNLVVFPSPFAKSASLGLRYVYVSDGVYEDRMNHVEAARVVDAAIDHIRNRSDDSLGIVTLNINQRDLIDEMLSVRLRSMPEADKFKERWESAGMGLFVKNLETVQGDERDCIIISTTFGKSKSGAPVRQGFGPISRQGGWRRLNVLFTRARKSVAVFSSMAPEDIVVDSKTPEGTRALCDYLTYARNGILAQTVETDGEPESDFEAAVIDILKAKGYDVTPQLGVAGFRLDIAVRHPKYPSTYLAAIECDGATYHSGVSVRDRDRIRQEILENIGWRNRIWRIWSTDWFRNPKAESEKLFSFLESCSQLSVPAEYTGTEPEKLIPPVQPIEPERPLTLSLGGDDDGLEIEVGDLITYSTAGELENHLTVKITHHQTDPSQGLISKHTPLAQTLIGATAGETVVLRVPAMPVQALVIHRVRREREAKAG